MTTALETPLTARGEVDEPAIGRLVNFVLDAGINGLFALGACGEYAAFDRATRRRVTELVKEAAGHRAPLIVGVSDNSTALVLGHIADAKERGADFVLCTPPNFYSLDQEEIKDFYLRLADKGGVPLIAYNCPLCKNHLGLETIVTLANHPMVVGLKETSTQSTLQLMHLALDGREDFLLISGAEYLYLAALEKHLEAVRAKGSASKLVAAVDAWLKGFSVHEDLQKVRQRMVDYIIRLRGALK